ncbi:MAG: hypothetical protein JWP47_2659 [Polaromonas sp.]|nr:hypothetical protein [Polaromonas sp.]
MKENTMKLIAATPGETTAEGKIDPKILSLDNTADPREVSLAGIERIDLHFPKFTDGRAFSQAFLLSRRLGFKGDIRATGDVLVDQLGQMERSGFTEAMLRADQNPEIAQRVLGSYPGYAVGKYQGDAVQASPHFVVAA